MKETEKRAIKDVVNVHYRAAYEYLDTTWDSLVKAGEAMADIFGPDWCEEITGFGSERKSSPPPPEDKEARQRYAKNRRKGMSNVVREHEIAGALHGCATHRLHAVQELIRDLQKATGLDFDLKRPDKNKASIPPEGVTIERTEIHPI